MYSFTINLTVSHVFFIVIFAFMASSFFRASGRAYEREDIPKGASAAYLALGLSVYAMIGGSLVLAYVFS